MRARLLWKLELTYVAVLLLVLLAVDFYAGRALRQQALDETSRRLDSLLTLALTNPPVSDASLHPAWAETAAQSAVRVTMIALDGIVLADSAENPQNMENHAGRPEIREALEKGAGRAVRYSSTVRHDMVYVARRSRFADGTEFILRFAAPLAEIEAAQTRVRVRLWVVSGIVLLLGATLSLLFSRALSRRVDELRAQASRIAAGDFRHLPVEHAGDELSALTRSLNATAAQLETAMQSLRQERDRAQAILRSTVEGIAVVDSEERLVFANRAFGAMLRVPPEAESRPLVEVVRQPDLLLLIRQSLREQRVVEGEIEIAEPENPTGAANFSVTASPVPSEGGSGTVLVLHEITELRRLERVRQDFVANVSHEFRTPLTAIQGFAETLLGGALEDKANSRRFLEIIRDHAVRLNRLTEDLLRLSQIEARKLELELRSVDVRRLFGSCVETAHVEAAQKKLTIGIECPANLPHVRADANLLREAVQNLLDNAVRYTPKGGKVTLEGSTRDGVVILAVRDTGIGIPKGEQQRIFERFYRVDPARSRELGGTGLGLSITKHIVEAQGGHIEVESEVGRGSTFRVFLPAA
jgi:two-component system phosphate regulon sensor histidine kinase PhoR